ncbi:MAG: (d)CMP kinase [Anaerolineales bacterium]|jgi:cytidylate kinase
MARGVRDSGIIAIDGTAASGKTTLARRLAEHLGYLYFDTGVMYRALTLAAMRKGLSTSDEANLTELAERITIDVRAPSEKDGRPCTVLLDGEDVTWLIRSEQVDQLVSPVSVFAGVRRALSAQQRRIGLRGRVVMVGRDIGTVVLPEADLKIFLDASLEERARRRHAELKARGSAPALEEVRSSLAERDRIDSGRSVAPLRAAEDALYIDSTRLNVQEVYELVEALVSTGPAQPGRAGKATEGSQPSGQAKG